jgi:hypothetical protein
MRLKTLLVCLSAFLLSVIVIATGCNRDPVVPAGIFVGTPTATFTATVVPNPTAAPSSTPIVWAGQTTNTSSKFQNVSVPPYIVQTNYWNSTPCPTMQTVNINNVTGAFSVIAGPNCTNPNTVGSYPNIFLGNEEGVTAGTTLPSLLSNLHSVTSSWNFTPGGTSADAWDIAYDIWLGPTANCTGSGFPCGGTELMIWVDYLHTNGYSVQVGTASISGSQWNVWVNPPGSWTYMAYVIQNPSATPVNNLNILAFIQDAETRTIPSQTTKCVNPAWYLYSIPAGIELRQGGIPFTSNSFSVSIQ